jgi:O-antigen/teichoic acid export membrane protein
VLGVATILFGLPLLTFGLIGLAVSQVLVYVVALAMAGRLLGGIPRPTWDPVIARRLVSVGFPIMLAGLLFGLLTTIDRWLVLIYLDRVQVGYYGIVGITVSGLLLLPGIVSQQYYPRLAFAYGAGQGGEALLALASRQSLISGGLVGVAAIAAAFVAVIGIPRFLPAYETAVVPLLVTLVGLGIYGLGAAFGDLLNTIGAQRRYLAIQALVLAVDVALSVVLLLAGLQLVGVAIALTFSMTIYAILLFANGRVLTRRIDQASATERG